MTLPLQLFGTIKVNGVSRHATICGDLDIPDEAMVQWGASEQYEAGGILMKVKETQPDTYLLTFKGFFPADAGGGLYPVNSETLRNYNSLKEITAYLKKRSNSFFGRWSGLDEDGGQLRFRHNINLPTVRARKLRNWSAFKLWASSKHVEGDFVDFRGHGCKSFKLISAFHRTKRARMERFCYQTMPKFQALAESVLDMRFTRGDPNDFAIAIGLAQHHGLPTPLIDWSASPYVAAFFAFSDALENSSFRSGSTHVRIYGLSRAVSGIAPNVVTLTAPAPHVSYLHISPWKNPRLLAQQGRFLVTNLWDLEGFLCSVEKQMGVSLLTAVDVPIACAAEALEDLQFMGLSAASMFPGLDGISRMMKHEMYFRKKI